MLTLMLREDDETEVVLYIINYTDGPEATDSRGAGDFDKYHSAASGRPDNRSLNQWRFWLYFFSNATYVTLTRFS